MKRLIAAVAVFAAVLGTVRAQDLASATECYNAGAEAISAGDKESALKSFEEALAQADALGEEGAEIVENCKNVIPNLYLSTAKDLVKASKFDEAVARLDETVAAAEKYGAADVAGEAKELKAGTLLSAKNYEGAAAAYKELLDADPANGAVALRLGVALNGAGRAEEAKAAFEQAAANGQEAAKKQLGTIYLKEALASMKAKKYADAVASAVKVNDYSDNAQAWQVAGQASQAAGKNADAIQYFEKYLEAAPGASNAGAIAFTVGALYQQAKNNAKAREFYSKAVSDPKYGAEAKKMLDALK